MAETKMPAEDDARVMRLLQELTDGVLTEPQAEGLYNDIVVRVLRVPAEYQIALGMQMVEDSRLPLTTVQAEKFVTCALFCLCYTDDAGTPGWRLVTREQVENWRHRFQPLFHDRKHTLDRLMAALRACGMPRPKEDPDV